MEFNPSNLVVKRCLEGMAMAEKGNPAAAHKLFLQAWTEATEDLEKFIAAYYVARHQSCFPRVIRARGAVGRPELTSIAHIELSQTQLCDLMVQLETAQCVQLPRSGSRTTPIFAKEPERLKRIVRIAESAQH